MTFTPRRTATAGQAARCGALGRHRWGRLSLVAMVACLSVLMGTAPGAYAEEPAASPSASPSAAPTPTDSASPEPAPTASPAGDPSPAPPEPALSEPAPAAAPSPEASAPPEGGTSTDGSESLPAASSAQITCGELQEYCDAVLGGISPKDLQPLIDTATQLVRNCLGTQAASTQSTSANLECGALVAELRQAALDAVDTVLACANGSNETCAAVIQLVLALAGEATGCANALGANVAPGSSTVVDCAALAAQLKALANELVALVLSCANRTEPTCSTAYDLANGAVATVVKCATDFLAGIGDSPAAATTSASTSSSTVDCYPLGVLVGDTVEDTAAAVVKCATDFLAGLGGSGAPAFGSTSTVDCYPVGKLIGDTTGAVAETAVQCARGFLAGLGTDVSDPVVIDGQDLALGCYAIGKLAGDTAGAAAETAVQCARGFLSGLGTDTPDPLIVKGQDLALACYPLGKLISDVAANGAACVDDFVAGVTGQGPRFSVQLASTVDCYPLGKLIGDTLNLVADAALACAAGTHPTCEGAKALIPELIVAVTDCVAGDDPTCAFVVAQLSDSLRAVSACLDGTTCPSEPEDVFATNVVGGSATVFWSSSRYAGATPVTSHTVTARPGGATTSVASGTTFAVVSGLALGTFYDFVVTAWNSNGSSWPSQPSGVVRDNASAPMAPSQLDAVFVRGDSAAQSGYVLSALPDDADGGLLSAEFAVVEAGGLAVATISSGTLPQGAGAEVFLPATSLVPGTSYSWTVKVFDGVYYSTAMSGGVIAGTLPSTSSVKSEPAESIDAPAVQPVDGVSGAPEVNGSRDSNRKTTIYVHGLDRHGDGGLNCGTTWNDQLRYQRERAFPDQRTAAYYADDRNCTGAESGTPPEARDGIYSYGSHAAHFAHSFSPSVDHKGIGHINDTDIRHLGYHLAWYIYSKYSRAGVSVDVVGHSMGGLILRWALYGTQEHRLRNDPMFSGFPPFLLVEDAITIGTPHRGSNFNGWTTSAGCDKVQCQQMASDSPFIKFLKDAPRTHNPQGSSGTDWTLVGSVDDNIVHYSSATGMSATHKVVYKSSANVTHSDYAHQVRQERDAEARYSDNNGGSWMYTRSFAHCVPVMSFAMRYESW